MFFSITLPEEIKRGMTAIQGRLRASGADVSWTRPEGMHLTLKFLGEVEEKRVPKIKDFTFFRQTFPVFPSDRRKCLIQEPVWKIHPHRLFLYI
ncbi:MAG: hypothetical protein HZA18_03575 [Nitrospirae bacterium]|nr:hypothetical protein [Nitrospirota bacterium]